MATSKRRTKLDTVLDPAREAKSFRPSHASLVDAPGNGLPFLLVQDDHTEKLYGVLADLSFMLGPNVQYTSVSAYDGLHALYSFIMPKVGDDAVMPIGYRMVDNELQFSAPEDTPFTYNYPTPEQVAKLLLDIDVTSEDQTVNDAVEAVRSLLEAYSAEQWTLSDDAIYANGGMLKRIVSDLVIKSVARGEDATAIATLAERLDADHGVVILRNTPLWDFIERAHEDPTEEKDEEDEEEEEKEGAAPSGEKEKDEDEEEDEEEDETRMKDFAATSPGGLGNTIIPAPATQQSDPVTAERRATSHIRDLIRQQDPTLAEPVVEPAPVQQGGGANQFAAVNTEVPVASVSGSNMTQDGAIEQLRVALATPGLTDAQKLGIVRHFLGEEEPTEAPQGGISAELLGTALQAAMGPVVERLAQLEQTLSETDVPLRRSIRPQARAIEDEGRPYRPYKALSVEEVARRNMPY
jgi:hypothetical protein